MTPIDSVQSNHSDISSETTNSKKSLDFWNFVSRKPIQWCLNLNERVWRVLSSFQWAEIFHQKALLRLVLNKLEETTVTAENLLTENERAQALLSVLWSLDTHSHSIHHEFSSELQKRGFLFNFSDKKDELAHEIRRFRSPISDSCRKDNFKKLESFLDPRLLYPLKGPLITLNAAEFAILKTLFSFEGQKDPTFFFQHLVAFIKCSSLSDKLKLIGQHSIYKGPFLVDGKLVTVDFESHKLSYLEAILQYYPYIQNAPLIHQKIDNKTLNILEATALGVISIYALTLSPFVEKDKLSSLEKEIYDLIARLPTKRASGPRYNIDKWIFLESRLQEIQSLRQRKEKGENVFLNDEPLLFDIYLITNDFKDFISLHKEWPCPIIQELSLWENIPNDIQANIEVLKKDLETYQKRYRTTVQNKIKLKDRKHLPDLKDLQFLDELVNHLAPYKTILPPDFLEEIQRYLTIYGSETEVISFDPTCPINICFFKTPSLKGYEDYPLWIKIKNIALSFFMPYGHTNFSFKQNDRPQKLGLGLSVYEGEISGFGSSKVETYALLPERFLDQKLSQAEESKFRAKFYELFLQQKDKINRNHFYPKTNSNIVIKYLSGFIPSLIAEKPGKYLSEEKKEMFCSEFVIQMVAETVEQTCKSLSLPSPESMSMFGVKRLQGTTPNELRARWLSKGVIQ